MSFTHRITPADLHRIDASDMAGHISSMGAYIRDAVSLCSSLELPITGERCKGVIVLGMGGSAIGGDLVGSYLSRTLSVPLFVNRSYELPAFANDSMLIIASSYSGTTEETLSAFEQAVSKKLPIFCITTGGTLGRRAKELGLPVVSPKPGMQPRAALAYSFVPILLALEKLGFTSGEANNLERAAAMADTITERCGITKLDDRNPAFKLGGDLVHRIPIIYAAADEGSLALRWHGQMNENAKHFASSNVVSEMNHNELEGWLHPVDLVERCSMVLLRTSDEHPRIAKRFEIMKAMFRNKQVDVFECVAEGETRIERLFSLISLADWISYYMALFSGIDPTSIEAIDEFKQKLQ